MTGTITMGKKSNVRQLRKFAQSYRMNIPVDIVQEAGMQEDDYVIFSAENGKIIISPVEIVEK